MSKHTEPAGQLHLFGQLDIWDCADDDTAAAPAAPATWPAGKTFGELDPVQRTEAIRSAAAKLSAELEATAPVIGAILEGREPTRREMLEAATELGRRDVAAGADPFAGISSDPESYLNPEHRLNRRLAARRAR